MTNKEAKKLRMLKSKNLGYAISFEEAEFFAKEFASWMFVNNYQFSSYLYRDHSSKNFERPGEPYRSLDELFIKYLSEK